MKTVHTGPGTVAKNMGAWGGKKSGKVGRKHHSFKAKSGGGRGKPS